MEVVASRLSPPVAARSTKSRREMRPLLKSRIQSLISFIYVALRSWGTRYDPLATAGGSDSLPLLLRHARCHAVLFQIRFEHFSNQRVFIRVIDHVAARMKADRIQAMCAAAATHTFDPILAANPGCGHVFCRTLAGVEV